jgi:hypothetical protein
VKIKLSTFTYFAFFKSLFLVLNVYFLGASYVRATCVPADELEPCLRGSIHSHHDHFPEIIYNQALVRQATSEMARFNKSKHRRGE